MSTESEQKSLAPSMFGAMLPNSNASRKLQAAHLYYSGADRELFKTLRYLHPVAFMNDNRVQLI
jgi:hypothetical protein